MGASGKGKMLPTEVTFKVKHLNGFVYEVLQSKTDKQNFTFKGCMRLE